MPQQVYLTDGSLDFSLGVDSGKNPLIASDSNPNGLRRDQVAWLVNGTVRGGGITQRAGWKYLTTIADGQSLYQGGHMYEPANANPYLLLSIGGHLLQVACGAGAVPTDLSAVFGFSNPASVEQAYFAQGEHILFWQAGDFASPCKFWDGAALTQSWGFTPAPGVMPQIPAAGPMDYYMGRLWYSRLEGSGWVTAAGDIVGGNYGTAPYYKDSIKYVTENPLAAAGDGFSLPAFAGPIRALHHSDAIDKALGEGNLFIFTRKNVTKLEVPITRADWTSTTEPAQKVVQGKYGTPAERSIVNVNGDLFYITMEPGVRTLALAIRYFGHWANTSISRNMNRVVPFQDRALLRFGSGILFANRLYMTCLPYTAGPVGVAHPALQVLDFDVISSFQDQLENAPIPAWEGIAQGLNVLQLFSGDFGGLDRAFAVVTSSVDGSIQLWELTSGDKFETNATASDNRVTWQFELPAYDGGNAMQFKELHGGLLWFDQITGKVDVSVEYRSDEDACYHPWAQFDRCYARTSCEDLVNPICYPVRQYGEGSEKPLMLPHPNAKECASNSVRPACYGYCFQPRITVRGFCRFRGFMPFMTERQISIYSGLVC